MLGGDFKRLACTLGELTKGAEGPQHITNLVLSARRFRQSTAHSLLSDLQRGTGVQIPDQTLRNRLHNSELKSRRPFVGLILNTLSYCSPEGVCQRNTELASSPLAPFAFHRLKSVQLKWIWQTRKGLENHRGALSGMQRRPARQVC